MFTAGSDDDDALWMDSMGIMQERTTIMYPSYIIMYLTCKYHMENELTYYSIFLSVIVDLL